MKYMHHLKYKLLVYYFNKLFVPYKFINELKMLPCGQELYAMIFNFINNNVDSCFNDIYIIIGL